MWEQILSNCIHRIYPKTHIKLCLELMPTDRVKVVVCHVRMHKVHCLCKVVYPIRLYVMHI